MYSIYFYLEEVADSMEGEYQPRELAGILGEPDKFEVVLVARPELEPAQPSIVNCKPHLAQTFFER